MIRNTLRTLVLVLALATTGLVSGLATSADAAVLSKGASTSHPFSDPTWFPLRGVVSVMGCAASNPNCSHGHTDRAMDLLSHTKAGRADYRPQNVYAAGAGIVHISRNIGNRCESVSSIGSSVWIDHGGGVVSRYGHFSIISVKQGQYVTPLTVLGKTGHSGEKASGDCNKVPNYLYFQIKHNGISGPAVYPGALRVCSGAKAVSWPKGIKSSYTSWQKVPNGTTLNDAAGAGNKCLSNYAALKTSAAPVQTSGKTAGAGKIKSVWQPPKAGYHVKYIQVELWLFHPTNNEWRPEIFHNITVKGKAATTYTFSKLLHHRSYRVRVSFCNGYGWSKASAWRNVKTT
jgi:hypothetical protein